MAQSAEVVIVGGGIWGLSTAYHLAKTGQVKVRVLERNTELANETTPQAAGLVGQIRSSSVMTSAIQYALELLKNFAKETGHDPGLKQTGSLLVALTPERLAAYEQQLKLARKNNVDASFVSKEEMRRLAPAINSSNVVSGLFVTKDGYLDPRTCALAFGAAAKDLGVQIDLGTRVTGLVIENGVTKGVETSAGRVNADHVVLASGPWVGAIAKLAGYRVAMQPIRHQRVVTVPTAGIPDHHPVVRVTDVSCYLRPEHGGYLYGFFEPQPTSIELESKPADFGTADIEPPVPIMEDARKRLTPIFPILEKLEIAERKQGMTTFAPDGAYLIGPVPDVSNLYLATGCAALGIAGSAAVGRWLANWITTGAPGEDLSKFALQRFPDHAADSAWVRSKAEKFYGSYYNIAPMIET